LPTNLEGMSVEQLRNELVTLRSAAGKLEQDNQRLIADAQTLSEKQFEHDRIQVELERVRSRISGLEIEEGNITTGISVAQEGFLPHSPYKDRRKMRAAAGMFGGLLLSFGVFYLWGTVDRRAYGTRQLSQEGMPVGQCLGVLPDLGVSLLNPESSEMASHCVHQIRNQIEAVRDPQDGYVMAVSSPFQGDGKTSIVMALGWSYAAAGFRTLVVDCDFVGRSLTRQLGLIGQEGVRDVLRRADLGDAVASLPMKGLSAIPVGVDPTIGPETLRRMDVERLLERLRGRFDVIIMDTGPLLGSLESTPVTTAADGVVLSVRRGRSRVRLEECLARLETYGANFLGVILNCAMRGDVVRYVSEASLAAAEQAAATRPFDDEEHSMMVPVSRLERNALMAAMEASARSRVEPEKGAA
jgi:tyrosine-protein kinase Etk/Wzc